MAKRKKRSVTLELSEADFQKQVIDYARLSGWRVAHFRKTRVQRKNGSVYYETPVAADGAGFPDLCLARYRETHRGLQSEGKTRLIFSELKTDRGKLSPKQKQWGDDLHFSPAEYYVWRPKDWKDIERILA